jgi:ketosteroid isomerase-like protein
MARNGGKITRAFFDAYNRRDWDALSALLAPAVSWFNAARRELIQGPDAVLPPPQLRRSLSRRRIGLHRPRDRRPVRRRVSYVTAGGKKSKRLTVCDVIELSEGRISRGTTYGDTSRSSWSSPGGCPICGPCRPVIRCRRLTAARPDPSENRG